MMNIIPPQLPRKITHDDVDRMRHVFRKELSELSVENAALKASLDEAQRLLAEKSDKTVFEVNTILDENEELKYQLLALTSDVKKYMASVEGARTGVVDVESVARCKVLENEVLHHLSEIQELRKEREVLSVKWGKVHQVMDPTLDAEDRNAPLSATRLVECIAKLASDSLKPGLEKISKRCPLPVPGDKTWGWKRDDKGLFCEKFGIRLNLELCLPSTRIGEIQWYIGRPADTRWVVGLPASIGIYDDEILYLGTANTVDNAKQEAEYAAHRLWIKLNPEPKKP
jgi:flagellar biosynthesis chaperone FliJ